MNNLEIIKSYHDAVWEQKDLNVIDQYFEENALIHSPLESTKGTEKMKKIIAQWLAAFPNLKVAWEDFICEGDKVVSRWRAQGTQEGEFLGNVSSSKKVDYSGVTIYQIQNEKINQYWALVDMDTVKKQLGTNE